MNQEERVDADEWALGDDGTLPNWFDENVVHDVDDDGVGGVSYPVAEDFGSGIEKTAEIGREGASSPEEDQLNPFALDLAPEEPEVPVKPVP